MISPLSRDIKVFSPNKELCAEIKNSQEIAMSAPTSGILILNSLSIDHCNPSMIWSEDSQYLAIPQWIEKNSGQRLLIISIQHGVAKYASGRFQVLQLSKFKDNIINGIDSPFHNPKPVEINIDKICW